MNEPTTTDFIRTQVSEDVRTGRHGGRVHTRFPPEPNGHLHIGHVKAIAIDFDIAAEFGGQCNLRFDDTNPVKEDQDFVDGIMHDIAWLGYEWDGLYYASDYFGQLYTWAQQLIRQGDAYVCDLSAEQMREYRGTLTEPGRNSPWRDRPAEESLDLLARMRAGEFPEGSRTLRAKIDMASPNINLRDPVMYRILHAHHHRTGDAWCLYPMYDWAHGQSDSMEGITHSLCSLEYEIHRPLYDWFLERLGIYAPTQMEFARLELTYTVLSKRKLVQLVNGGHVRGWDDPRMPTVAGMRRRGFPAAAIRRFVGMVGVSKANSTVDVAMLEYAVRDELNRTTPRVMAVLEPLKLVITNYPEGETEWVEVPDYPQDKENSASRRVPFGRNLWIERNDFAITPPRKYHRLSPGAEVRLLGAYYVTCTDFVTDEAGNVVEVHATCDPQSRGGSTPDGRKVPGTIHWVSADHALPATVNLYDRLFRSENPGSTHDFLQDLNPDSLQVLERCFVEPGLADAPAGSRFQFMRNGYFCVDPDSRPDGLIFNRALTLRDTWAKIAA